MSAVPCLLPPEPASIRRQTGFARQKRRAIWLGNSSDFAFLTSLDGDAVFGRGPFQAYSRPPKASPVLFYINDFALSLSHPWLEPAEVITDAIQRRIEGHGAYNEPADIEWNPPSPDRFRRAFQETQHLQSAGFWDKAVLAASQRGRIVSGSTADSRSPGFGELELLTKRRPADSGRQDWRYGFRLGNEGWTGVTPERLFQCSGRELQTMALAGTAPARSAQSLQADPKEIREHQIVADFIDERLSSFGRLRRSARRIVQQASVTHLRTDFQVDLDHTPDLDQLLRRLHPTPALGVWPRTESTMAALAKLRSQCATPRWFGAPFGLKLGSAFQAVVLIRGVFWRGSQIDLPSGCGVLPESSLSREWSELGWKREATRSLLGLTPGLNRRR